MFQNQLARAPSCSSAAESMKAIEADITHANSLSASIQQAYGGPCIQMRLSYGSFAPLILFLMRWMDYACIYSLPTYLGLLQVTVYKVYLDGKRKISSYERRATLRDFYGVIYPSLEQLENNLRDMEECDDNCHYTEVLAKMKNTQQWWNKLPEADPERDNECGICMEVCTKMVLPNCNHAMCINCYRDWNTKSQSCPFCRDSLKRVASRDLWVLTGDNDVVDTVTLARDNLKRFFLYIDKLPLAIPDSLFMVYYDYLV